MSGWRLTFPPQGTLPPAPYRQVSKGHGRIECREVWSIDSQELGHYLAQEFDWPALRLAGLVRRSRRRLGQRGWDTQETTIWVSSCPAEQLCPAQVAAYLRGHWTIENGLFRVRDVSYDEDRLHRRTIGLGLSLLRHLAINLIRREGYRFIPDGWRAMASLADRGLHLLLKN